MKAEDIDAMLARQPELSRYLRGMASDALGHAYTVSPADGATCGLAALTLEELALALRDALEANASVTAHYENARADANTAEAKVRDLTAEVERLRQVGGEAQREAEVCANERDAAEAKVRDLEAQRDAVLALCDIPLADVGRVSVKDVRAAMGATT